MNGNQTDTLGRRVAFHTLGCKVNSYETEAMSELFEKDGYEVVPFSDLADVYVINTCTVTNIADRKSRQMLHRARRQNQNALVVAVGCYVQADRSKAESDPAIDIVVGNNQKMHIVDIVEQYRAPHENAAEDGVADIDRVSEYEDLSIERALEHTRAYIKIQDGCNQFCSYCLIPYVRGRVRSRAAGDILAEAGRLVNNGYQEIVLTGIHVSSYGTDLSSEEPARDLLGLIQRLHDIEGLQRIRLGSLEPQVVTETFAKTLASLHKVCPHFHLSLQSGCDATLRRMNRRYTAEQYARACEMLRTYFYHPAITTDVIVGFPGESEEEFAQTYAFVESVHFFETHIFKYSKRERTLAARMPDQIAEPVKTKRSGQLIRLNERQRLRYLSQWLNKEVSVLFEETVTEDGISYAVGHIPEYCKVYVCTDEPLANQLRTVTVRQVFQERALLGTLIG